MRSKAAVRSLLWSPRLPITQPARAGLGGTNGSAEDQSTPHGTRGRFESPQRRSQFGDFTGRLARKTNGASSHVVARTANGASSDVVLGGLSPSSISDAMTSPPCCRTRTAARMWYLEPSCVLLVACMTVEWPLSTPVADLSDRELISSHHWDMPAHLTVTPAGYIRVSGVGQAPL